MKKILSLGKNVNDNEILEPNPLVEFFQKLYHPVLTYKRTREAILNGEKLWEYSKQDISKGEYLGPWTYNIRESIIAALPTILIVKIIEFKYFTDAIDSSTQFDDLYEKYYLESFERLDSYLQPLLIPLSLMLTSLIVSHVSLKRKDETASKKLRCKYAYLYLDGTHGLFAQAAAIYGVTLIATDPIILDAMPEWLSTILLVSSILSLILGSFLLIKLVYGTIPNMLLRLNGYNDVDFTTGQPDKDYLRLLRKYKIYIFLTNIFFIRILAFFFYVSIFLLASLIAWCRLQFFG